MNLLSILRWPVFAAALAVIVYMLVTLVRGGDERRELILAKAGLHTLMVTAAVLAIGTVLDLLEPHRGWEITPFGGLLFLSVCFAVELFFWSRRYGG